MQLPGLLSGNRGQWQTRHTMIWRMKFSCMTVQFTTLWRMKAGADVEVVTQTILSTANTTCEQTRVRRGIIVYWKHKIFELCKKKSALPSCLSIFFSHFYATGLSVIKWHLYIFSLLLYNFMINNKLRIDINRLNLCQYVYKIIPKPLYSQNKFEIKRRLQTPLRVAKLGWWSCLLLQNEQTTRISNHS